MIAFISNNAPVLIVLGFAITILMAVIVAVLLVKSLRRKPVFVVDVDMSTQIDELKAAAQHHMEVSSVVAMVRQLNELDPDALEQLRSYPQAVRAAAMLHYTNQLGADLREAHKRLSRAHGHVGYGWANQQANAQAHVDSLQAKLDAAIARSKMVMA